MGGRHGMVLNGSVLIGDEDHRASTVAFSPLCPGSWTSLGAALGVPFAIVGDIRGGDWSDDGMWS